MADRDKLTALHYYHRFIRFVSLCLAGDAQSRPMKRDDRVLIAIAKHAISGALRIPDDYIP